MRNILQIIVLVGVLYLGISCIHVIKIDDAGIQYLGETKKTSLPLVLHTPRECEETSVKVSGEGANLYAFTNQSGFLELGQGKAVIPGGIQAFFLNFDHSKDASQRVIVNGLPFQVFYFENRAVIFSCPGTLR